MKEEEEDHGEVGGKQKTVCCGEELEKKVEEQIEEGTASPSSKPGWRAALPPTLIDSSAVLCWSPWEERGGEEDKGKTWQPWLTQIIQSRKKRKVPFWN